jgi:hypothetical protein
MFYHYLFYIHLFYFKCVIYVYFILFFEYVVL